MLYENASVRDIVVPFRYAFDHTSPSMYRESIYKQTYLRHTV